MAFCWADTCWAFCYSFIRGIFHIYWAAYILLGLHFTDGEIESEKTKSFIQDHTRRPGWFSWKSFNANNWQMADQEKKNGSVWLQVHFFLPVNVIFRMNPIPGKFIAFLRTLLVRFRGYKHSWAVWILHKGAQVRVWGPASSLCSAFQVKCQQRIHLPGERGPFFFFLKKVSVHLLRDCFILIYTWSKGGLVWKESLSVQVRICDGFGSFQKALMCSTDSSQLHFVASEATGPSYTSRGLLSLSFKAPRATWGRPWAPLVTDLKN